MTTKPDETVREAHNRRALERYGWTPAENQRVCLRWLGGMACRAQYGGRCGGCWINFSNVLDHARMWVDENTSYLLTGEPYIDPEKHEEFPALQAVCKALELQLLVSEPSESVYLPDDTWLIEIRPANEVGAYRFGESRGYSRGIRNAATWGVEALERSARVMEAEDRKARPWEYQE